MPPTSPTVASWRLGLRLREKREELGLTGAAASRHAGIAPTYLSDVERGKKTLAEQRLEALIERYRFDQHEAAELRDLRIQTTDRAWWSRYSGLLPTDVLRYFGYEHGAAGVQSYDGGTVPTLLQTESYARAIIEAASPNVRLADAERLVEARLTRQRRLDDQDPLRLSAVVSEAALRQQVGGRDVLAGQLEHLLSVTERPQVSVTVVPFTATGHHAMGGSTFQLVTLPGQNRPSMVWQETVTSTALLSDPVTVREYGVALDGASDCALDLAASRDLIAGILRDLP